MALLEDDSLERLKNLHQDLVQLNESHFANIERLQTELESRVKEFRELLEREKRNDKSRAQLSSGNITLGDEVVSVNDDFKQDALQLAEFLDLDEIEAAKLYALALSDRAALDRPPLMTSIIVFHERRQYLVECLRICMVVAAENFDLEDEDLKVVIRTFMELVVRGNNGSSEHSTSFWRKTLSSMSDVEQWLQRVAERVQSMSLTGQPQSEDFTEIMDFQRNSLTRQHESLGAISFHLMADGFVRVEEFRQLLTKVTQIEKYDVLMIHYLPSLLRGLSHFGHGEGSCTLDEASAMQNMITSTKENDIWTSRTLQAAATNVWLAECSGRFADQISLQGGTVDAEAEAENRSKLFFDALREGGFHFLLAVAQDVKTSPWFDPLRKGLTAFLLHDTPAIQTETFTSEPFFQDIMMTQLQNFAEAFITNMPDTIRALRVDEDEQRRQMHTQLELRPSELPLHLERFYVIGSFAFEESEQATEIFWTETDSNLYGFLLWAAQRQSTPRVACFCELLRALSYGETCADYAHRFLLEDKQLGPGRFRRSSPLSWHHIMSELEFYSSTIRERPGVQSGKGHAELAIVEPESDMMLECYLRLITHLCHNSPAAREWLLTHPSFHMHEHLFLLCGSSIDSRLRANAITALSALLVNKNREVGDGMWTALDAWIYGVNSGQTSGQRQHLLQNTQSSPEQHIFTSIAVGFEEPNAFVGLLSALIAPFPEDAELNDGLPFPEALGAAYRMPGIEPYIDFVIGRVLAQKSVELQDPIQVRILRFNAFSFIKTCLASFNEDLVGFANQSSVSVDSAMRTSSLAAYAKLHPFARAMEWLFNDAVVEVLFDTIKQNVKEVNESLASSPLLAELLESIQVMTLALTLQSTYFDIVRPIVKLSNTGRGMAVANSALASFEDAILNHMDVIPTLGLYCGSGHQDLVVSSLQLLQKLAGSRKLAMPVTSLNRPSDKSRLITAVERNGEDQAIARSLASQTRFDERVLQHGPETAGFVMQLELLRFLNECLATVPDRPNLAHCLLGFKCHATSLDISTDGLFADGTSLFHAILRYLLSMPDGDGETLLSWLLIAKAEATGIFSKLLKSPLSSRLTLSELRFSEYFFVQWAKQAPIRAATRWDGRTFDAEDFYVSDSGNAYVSLIVQRTALLEYAALEMRAIDVEGLSSLKTRMLSTMLGVASFLDGTQVPCLSLFDAFDCIDSELDEALPLPQTKYFNLRDLDICRMDQDGITKYNVDSAAQLLILRMNEMRKTGQFQAQTDEQQMQADAENILFCLHANNRKGDIREAHIRMLRSWTHLIVVILQDGEFDNVTEKMAFVLHALQVVLPRLEQSCNSDIVSATLYAQLARSLLWEIASSPASKDVIAADATNDHLSQLFRVALSGVQDSGSSSYLRLSCIQICHDYLRHIAKLGNTVQRSFALHCISSRGEPLLEVLCDEAYAGEDANRIASLLLLGSFVAASNQEASKLMVEALVRINFIQVLVTVLKRMPQDFQREDKSDDLVTVYTVTLSLILLICQTRTGASHVVNAGLFASIRESGLFSADPDLGLEADNPSALKQYYALLLQIVNTIVACMISRGQENQQTISLVRKFCQDYRPLIVAVFKRSAGVGLMGEKTGGGSGGGSGSVGASVGVAGTVTGNRSGNAKNDIQNVIEELADSLMVLVGGCGWLDTEEESGSRKGLQSGLFT